MFEAVLLAAAMDYPVIFANEYCVNRWFHDMTHVEAIEEAKRTSLWSDGLIHSAEADIKIKEYCPEYLETPEEE